jgi:transposase
LRVTPDQPEHFPDQRSRGSRRPNGEARVAAVRKLVEQTELSYGEIAKRTGVGRATICRWTRDAGWQRNPFAPRATDTVPRARAGQKLKLRLLAERLRALTERYVRELEDAPRVEVEKLVHALELLKMARTEAQGRNRRRRRWPLLAETGQQWITRQEAIKTALKEMQRGGVNVDAAPQEAVDLVIDANLPAEDDRHFRAKGAKGAIGV